MKTKTKRLLAILLTLLCTTPATAQYRPGPAANVYATQAGAWNITSLINPAAVTGTFWQATQPVSGTFYQATQPVSIAAEIAVDASGHTVPVSGTVAATQSGTWNVGTVATITNPVAVTGTFWQATQPVSGTVAATQSGTWNVGTVATITNPVAVTGSFYQATQPVSGTFYQATQPVSIASSVAVTGSFYQATQPVSGTFYQATQPVSGTVAATQSGTWTVQPGNTANTTAWKVDGSAVTQPVSGTFYQATQPVSGTFYQATQPVSGTFYQATQPVSGTFWQTTQPVSGTVTANAGSGTMAVSGTFFQATQPISAAALPLPSGASQEHTTAASPSSVRLSVDGTNFNDSTHGAYFNQTQGNAVVSATNGSYTNVVQGNVAVSAASALYVQEDVTRATYYCDTGTYTTAASPTDIFTLQGSGTKTIRIVAVYAITAATLPTIIRRSSADTTGTSASLTNSKYDSGDGNATAATLKYTANPGALGTTAATFVNQIAAASATTPLWQVQTYQKPIYIRGTTEYLVLNGGPSAGSVRFVIIWTEE